MGAGWAYLAMSATTVVISAWWAQRALPAEGGGEAGSMAVNLPPIAAPQPLRPD